VLFPISEVEDKAAELIDYARRPMSSRTNS
jgi:hypothetical protein